MRLHNVLIVLLLGVFVFSMHPASAVTVSLTGSCPLVALSSSSNSIHFNLANTGDGEATNLVVIPSIAGADVSPGSLSVPALGTGNSSMAFYLSNLSNPGDYVGVFNVKYSQEGYTFFAAFPCLYYIENASVVEVSILNASLKISGKYSDSATVSIFNFGKDRAELSIVPFAPLNFNVTPSMQNMTLGPGSGGNVTFEISELNTGGQTNSSFAVGFYAQYTNGSVHYSTPPYVIYFTGEQKNGYPLILVASGAIAAVIVALIVASVFVSKRSRRRKEVV